MYSDEVKDSGENESFSYKIIVFHDICIGADVPGEAKLKELPTVLRLTDYEGIDPDAEV